MIPKGWMTLKQISKNLKKEHGIEIVESELNTLILKGVVTRTVIKGVKYYKLGK